MVWDVGLLCKLKSYVISVWIFSFIWFFLNSRWLCVVLDGKFLQEYPVNIGVPQGFILAPKCFLFYTNELLYDVICKFGIYGNDTTLYSKCDQASDLCQKTRILNLNLTYKWLEVA